MKFMVAIKQQKAEDDGDKVNHDDKAVQTVPGLCQVRLLPPNPHGNHFDDHFNGEESKDEVVEALENATPYCGAHLVAARLIHAQRYTVEDDHEHGDALEPCTRYGLRIFRFIVLEQLVCTKAYTRRSTAFRKFGQSIQIQPLILLAAALRSNTKCRCRTFLCQFDLMQVWMDIVSNTTMMKGMQSEGGASSSASR
ncbi:hypothetical protein PoB_006835500 [Plakobranchus ocellatus]|uniref:Uncharacterized protein n=1 Tax=Plakobranchus ocellatus TaxID=259542 RepID=A0AAV4DD11_9GAST|nr:hypothetical protein PoB_006835500 [Plakobranchus ocellatus]